MAESSPSLMHHVGHKFHEVFQLKPRSYADLPAAKISEMLKSVSLNNAPTQSLLSVVNDILEESVKRRNGEMPHVWPWRVWFGVTYVDKFIHESTCINPSKWLAQTHVTHTVS